MRTTNGRDRPRAGPAGPPGQLRYRPGGHRASRGAPVGHRAHRVLGLGATGLVRLECVRGAYGEGSGQRGGDRAGWPGEFGGLDGGDRKDADDRVGDEDLRGLRQLIEGERLLADPDALIAGRAQDGGTRGARQEPAIGGRGKQHAVDDREDVGAVGLEELAGLVGDQQVLVWPGRRLGGELRQESPVAVLVRADAAGNGHRAERDRRSTGRLRHRTNRRRLGVNRRRLGVNRRRHRVNRRRHRVNRRRHRVNRRRHRVNRQRHRVNRQRHRVNRQRHRVNRQRQRINRLRQRVSGRRLAVAAMRGGCKRDYLDRGLERAADRADRDPQPARWPGRETAGQVGENEAGRSLP